MFVLARNIFKGTFASKSSLLIFTAIMTVFCTHSACKGCLNGQGHVAVNKPVISRIYIVAHTWPLCHAQIWVDGVNPH